MTTNTKKQKYRHQIKQKTKKPKKIDPPPKKNKTYCIYVNSV